jgi:excisionase family DNA binding protein
MTVPKNRVPARPDTLLPETQSAIRRLESIAEAAARYGCHPRTIRRRVADGSLTGYRFGPALIRVDVDEVDGLLAPIPAAGYSGDAA